MSTSLFHNPLSLHEAVASTDAIVHFDLSLKPKEVAAFQALQIKGHRIYSNYGDLADILREVSVFLELLGNSSETSNIISEAINRLTHDTVRAFNTETAWVELRASLPHTAFDIPRWHQDGYHFLPHRGTQRKVVFTPKGARTLFARFPRKVQAEIVKRARGIEFDDLKGRAALAQMVESKGSTESASTLQGSIFTAGSKDAAIHSEPPIRESRLFISVVPGSRKQIQTLDDC